MKRTKPKSQHKKSLTKTQSSVTANLFPNADSLNTNTTYDAEQRAIYDATRGGAYTVTRGTGNNIMALPLSNITSNAASIISKASAYPAASALPSGAPDSVLKGYTAARKILLQQYASQRNSIATVSWNTGSTTSIYMVKPLSRGSVLVANASDPLAEPRLDFNALADPTDLETTLAVLRKNRLVMASPFMQGLGPVEAGPAGVPGVEDEERLKAALRAAIVPSNAHPCCTAAIGKEKNGAVVDEELRVYGVKGLRVVDASVFPFIIRTAPSGTVYAVGEKVRSFFLLSSPLPLSRSVSSSPAHFFFLSLSFLFSVVLSSRFRIYSGGWISYNPCFEYLAN